MSDTDKRIIVYNTQTGKLIRNLDFSEDNLLQDLGADENLIVIPKDIKLQSIVDNSDQILFSSIPEGDTTVKGKIHDINLPGPNNYRIPRKPSQLVDAFGKIILGGQHDFASSLKGEYFPGGPSGPEENRYAFSDPSAFSNLKLVVDDHFQILNTNINVIDGIYRVKGFSSRVLNTQKVLGTTFSTKNTFSYTGTGDGFTMIRLQPVDGSVYGASAEVEGCGIYRYNEKIRQSILPVTNTNGVQFVTSTSKRGGASAYFPNASGSNPSYLSIDTTVIDGYNPSPESGEGVVFRMNFWVKFATNPTSDQQIVGFRKTGNGHFYFYYENSSTDFVLKYNKEGETNFPNTLSFDASSYTLTNWNHIQLEVAHAKEIRLYANGFVVARADLAAQDDLFNGDTDHPLTIGANFDGTNPFYGYIDELEMLWSIATTATQDGFDGAFLAGPTGSTTPVGFTAPNGPSGYATYGGITTHNGVSEWGLVFNFNGPNGCELFTEDGIKFKRKEANVVGYDHDRRVLYFTNYGTTLTNTFSSSANAPYLRGFNDISDVNTVGVTGNSQARHPVLGVETGITEGNGGITNYRTVLIEGEKAFHARTIGLLGMSGDSLGTGDFKNLFGVAGACAAFGSRVLTFAPTDDEVQRISAAVLQTGVSGVSLSADLVFNDLDGTAFSISETFLDAFHADVSIYRASKDNALSTNISTIESATTLEGLAYSGNNSKVNLSYTPYGGSGTAKNPNNAPIEATAVSGHVSLPKK